ncbi:hypothetical protein WMY93_031063 [Mugilogobius chulae]|uniref:Male-enhanced antigen 1 n=1 Tax=Mugilogobius chulae TaxID=88201 RepID=A0AAW0MHC3_9GOBI
MGPERVFPSSDDDVRDEERHEPINDEDDEQEAEPEQALQQRMEVMGLHLPEAPPPEAEEEDRDWAEAQRSRASIPMDADHVELVKRTMASLSFPSLGVPPWAQQISDDQWKDLVQTTLQRLRASTRVWTPLSARCPSSGPRCLQTERGPDPGPESEDQGLEDRGNEEVGDEEVGDECGGEEALPQSPAPTPRDTPTSSPPAHSPAHRCPTGKKPRPQVIQ